MNNKHFLHNVQVMRDSSKADFDILIEYEVRINNKIQDYQFYCQESDLVEHLEACGVLHDAQYDAVFVHTFGTPEIEDELTAPEIGFEDFLRERMANDCKEEMHLFLMEYDRNYPY